MLTLVHAGLDGKGFEPAWLQSLQVRLQGPLEHIVFWALC